MKPYDITERRAGYFFILIFTTLAVGIITTGYFYYRQHELYIRSDMENQLSSIAKLKAGELALWRKERLADGNVLLNNTAFSSLVRRFLENPDDDSAQQLLGVWIGAHMKSYQYTGVSLFDAKGVVRMSAPKDWDQIDTYSPDDIMELMRPRRTAFLDFNQNTPDGPIHLSILIPIFNGPDFSHPLGIIVFDIDPQTYLYPFISKAPTPTRTAETLLVRRDGDSVLFLNDLRFRKNAALKLRIPLTNTTVSAVMAALGKEGVVEGLDYRGAQVISAIKSVPGSPWYLVAKIDESEVYGTLRGQLLLVFIAVVGLLIAAGAAIYVIWRQQSLRYYRDRFETAEALRESEARLRSIMDNTLAVIYLKDAEGRYIMVNRRFETLFGVRNGQISGKTDHDVFPLEMASAFRENDLRVISAGKTLEFEEMAPHADGPHIYISIKFPLFDANAKIYGICGMSTDITERKQIETALAKSEERFRNIVETTNDWIWEVDENMVYTYASPQSFFILGYTPDEIVGKTPLDLMSQEEAQKVAANIEKIIGERLPIRNLENTNISKDGRLVILETSGTPIFDASGKFCGYRGIDRDITNRKRAEEDLIHSERKYRSLFTNMRNGFAYCKMIFDENNKPLDWIYLQVNDAFERVAGLKREAVEGKKVTEVFPGIRDFRPNLFEIYGRVALTGEGVEFTINFDISSVWLSISAYCPQPGCFATVFDDVSDLKKAESALLESEELHRTIMQNANDAIICVDNHEKIYLWNRKAVKMFGYSAEEAIGKNVHEFITPEKYREQARAGFAKFLATGEGVVINTTREITALRKGGLEFPIELSVAAVRMKDGWGASAIIKDITARKEWERKLTETNDRLKAAMDNIERTHTLLIRQEKLAALGQLSAGVAHEIKNPLNIISTSTQLMMMEKGLPDEVMGAGKIILEQIARAVKIIDNLRDFARERKPERKEIDLHAFIEKMMSLVEYELRSEGIEIALEFSPGPIQIMGDEDQLAQVFLNITNNARDSMNLRKKMYSFEEAEKIGWKARLTVWTRVEEGKAKISFEDNGLGISEDNKRKVFTPFFTTKDETKGTGLGTAIAFGIIENHGGTIEFESEDGKGAVFTVRIPLAG